MKLDEKKIKKGFKITTIVLLVVFFIEVVVLCCSVVSKSRQLKAYRAQNLTQIEQIAKANAKADSLAKLDCITINNTVVINTKGLVNINQTNQVAKTVATYTRGEVLNAIDSLQKIK